MRSKPWMSRVAWTLASLIVFAAILYATRPVVIGQSRRMVDRMEDTNNLRQLVGPVARSGKLPLKDGAFDPYALFRNGEVVGTNLKLFGSARSGTGPTDEEIERGDYTNFPWGRYRGDGNLEGPPFPLLWERKPDDKGKVLAGFSDGNVAYTDHASFKAR